MGEVAQAGGAEDEAESQGTERDDQGQNDSVQDELEHAIDSDARENATPAAGITALADGYEREEGLLIPLEDIDRALGTVPDLDPQGQRGNINRCGVFAR